MEPHRLTPQAAARELGVSTDTLKRWEAEGRIAATRTLGGHRRFDLSEIERLKRGGDPAGDSTTGRES